MLATCLLLAAAAGCGSSSSADTERADIRGVIKSVTRSNAAGEVRGSVLIEGSLEPDTGFDKTSVTVTGKTAVFRREDGTLREASFDSLREGQRVQAAFTGPVAESYPVQATAKSIIILGEGSRPANEQP